MAFTYKVQSNDQKQIFRFASVVLYYKNVSNKQHDFETAELKTLFCTQDTFSLLATFCKNVLAFSCDVRRVLSLIALQGFLFCYRSLFRSYDELSRLVTSVFRGVSQQRGDARGHILVYLCMGVLESVVICNRVISLFRRASLRSFSQQVVLGNLVSFRSPSSILTHKNKNKTLQFFYDSFLCGIGRHIEYNFLLA